MKGLPPEGAVWPLSELRIRRGRSKELYIEFLRIPPMSVGLYELPKGGVDPQTPHREDEIYHVIRGRATISIAGTDRPVAAGATIFVAQGVEHRFHSVTESLQVLVVFAPQESPEISPKHSEDRPRTERAGKVS